MEASQFLPETITLNCIEITGEEPISLSDAKLYLRVDTDEDDDLIAMMISSSRAAAEGKTHRILRDSIWQWIFTCSKNVHEVPLVPCLECFSVKVNGEEVDTSLYAFTPGGVGSPLFAKISIFDGFPEGEVAMTLKCGYASNFPEDLKRWIFVRLGDAYEQRESFAVGSNFHEFNRNFVDALLDPFLIPDC